VFLTVNSALPHFRGESRLTTWIYRIALRTALRVRARRRPSEPLDPELPGGGGEDAMRFVIEARRLAAALGRLPAEQRAVLSLFALDGLGHAAIAEILGVPEGTVWSRLHAARKRLAAELGRGR
jgi:RNA polymerase sigma-70 factor (ECF subfamily)